MRSRLLLAGLLVVLYASAFPAIRIASPELGPIGLSFARLAIAALVLLAVAPLFRARLPRSRDLPLIIVCGLLGMTFYQLFLNAAELEVPAGTASMIVAAAPVVSVAIATIAFREPLSWIRIAGSGVALVGVALVCLSRAGISLSSAVWLVVGAMVVQGAYYPLIKPLLRRYSGFEVALYAMVVGALAAAPLLPWGWAQLASASPGAWLGAVYLGLVPSALGFVLWNYAVGGLPVVLSTSLLYLVPPVAVLLAFLLLGELPVWGELLGGLVVIAGVAVVGLGDRLRERLSRHVGMSSAPRIMGE